MTERQAMERLYTDALTRGYKYAAQAYGWSLLRMHMDEIIDKLNALTNAMSHSREIDK